MDDFKWFLPTDEWAGDLSAPAEITKQQLLRPPVVNQTRPMEGYHTEVPRRLRRGRDVRTADDPLAVDARQISEVWKIHRKSECVMTVVPTLAAASQADYEVVQPRPPGYRYTDSLPLGSGRLESFRMDTPEGSPPAEIKISRSPDTLQTELSATSTEIAGGSPPADIDICDGPDRLQTEISATTTEMTGGSPPAEIRISKSPDRLQTEISVTSTEMAGGSPPAHIDICEGPDRLQTEISVTSTEMASGSPPADSDICVIPEVLPIATCVKTVMSDKFMKMDTPDVVVNSMKIAGGSPPAEFTISESPDWLQTVISVTSTEMAGGNPPADRDHCESPELLQRAGSVTAVVSEKWMERFVIKPKVMCSDDSAPDDDPAGRSSDVSSIACVQNQIPTVVSVQTVVSEKWMDRFVFGLVECFVCFQDECGGPDVQAGRF